MLVSAEGAIQDYLVLCLDATSWQRRLPTPGGQKGKGERPRTRKPKDLSSVTYFLQSGPHPKVSTAPPNGGCSWGHRLQHLACETFLTEA